MIRFLVKKPIFAACILQIMARENVYTFGCRLEVLDCNFETCGNQTNIFTHMKSVKLYVNGQVAIVGGNEQHFSLGMFTNPLHIGKWLFLCNHCQLG